MPEEERITIAQMQKDIDYVKRDLGELKNLVVELPQKIDNAIGMLSKEFDSREEQYNAKYAPKAAWDVLVWTARSLGVVIVGVIVYLILKFGHLVL